MFQNNLKNLFSTWKSDLTAGITVAIVALPLALAFAVASGVEPKAGLYTAIIAGILASLFGGSKFQITGPTGAMAVILIDIVRKYGIEEVWLAGFMAGAIQLILGINKLGGLVKFIPYPVITGFTNGIAIIIFCGQINNFLGLQLPRADDLFLELTNTVKNLSLVNWAALSIGGLVVLINIFWNKFDFYITRKIPASLVSLVLATAVCNYFDLSLPRIGEIPQQLPMPQGIPNWNNFAVIHNLMPAALALAALGSIESLLSAMVADSMTDSQRHDSNKELIGQGIANMVVPFFGGIPATGAIARTAVNIRAGGKGPLSGIVQGLVLALIVLAFAPWAEQIPLAALAGILLVVSFRMLEWEEVKLLVKTTRSDTTVLFLTFFLTIFFDLILAVEVGLIAAGVLFIKKMSDLSLTKMPEEKIFEPGVPEELSRQIVVYRVDGPLFFGVAERFVNVLHEITEVKILVLRMRYVSNIDSSGVVALEEIYRDLKSRGCKLVLSGMRSTVRSVLDRSGVLGQIGRENCFESAQKAIKMSFEEISVNK
ncbi:MAG: SulP family inorganic anion transporter [Candidatus Caenarcaniphilales bacterium]|nr:SulP family inorganic anion transporter [Candidatus Caenarcaniphilales bacterium]